MDCIFDWFHAIQKKGSQLKLTPFFSSFPKEKLIRETVHRPPFPAPLYD